MALNHALSTYQMTSIETADPLQLIILCYDATIRDLEEARDLHERHEMDEAYRKIRHAQDIVTELLVGLNYERGGDIARNLNRLYNFILRELIGINSRGDTTIYNHLIKILSELRGAWEEIRLSPHMPSMDSMPVGRAWQASA